MGGVMIISSIDNYHIHPIGGHKFLLSCHIISCFKMVTLENSVQASNDEGFSPRRPLFQQAISFELNNKLEVKYLNLFFCHFHI